MNKTLKILYAGLVSYGLTGAFFIPWNKLTWQAFWQWIIIWPHVSGDKAWYLIFQWLAYFIVIAFGIFWFSKLKTDRWRIFAVVAVLFLLTIIGAIVSWVTGL